MWFYFLIILCHFRSHSSKDIKFKILLEFIKPNYVHIMKDGNIVKTGDYSLAQKIEKDGYDSINEVKEEDNNA